MKEDLKLLLKRKASLSDEENARVKRLSSRISHALMALAAIGIGFAYIHLFRSQPPGPVRNIMLDIINAMTFSLVAGFVTMGVADLAKRLRPSRGIPVSVAAGILIFVGGNALLDVAMRLKAEIPRSEVRVASLMVLGRLVSENGPPSDPAAYVLDASDLVRSFRDRGRAADFMADPVRIRDRLGIR